MTEKLYNQNSYLKEADAKIIDIQGENVILNRTIFAPDSGGQPWDLGTLGGFEIDEVTEKNGVIYHKLKNDDTAMLNIGDEIHMKLDWERRFDHMQNHIGEHILSGIFKSEYYLDNKGFHLGEEIGTFDIDSKEITQEMIDRVEELANDAVYRAVPIEVILLKNTDEAAKLPLRKELKVDEDIRVVSIAGVDCVACCCPHPSDTSQVGIIKIVSTEKYKGMTRIYFKCGKRAFLDYRCKHLVISELAEKYSADEFTLSEKIKIAEKKSDGFRRELNHMKDRFAAIKADELADTDEKIISSELDDVDIEELRRITKKLSSITDKPMILSSAGENCVLLTCAENSNINMGGIVKEYAVGFGGKGGGRKNQAQAFFQESELMRNFIKIAEVEIENKLK